MAAAQGHVLAFGCFGSELCVASTSTAGTLPNAKGSVNDAGSSNLVQASMYGDSKVNGAAAFKGDSVKRKDKVQVVDDGGKSDDESDVGGDVGDSGGGNDGLGDGLRDARSDALGHANSDGLGGRRCDGLGNDKGGAGGDEVSGGGGPGGDEVGGGGRARCRGAQSSGASSLLRGRAPGCAELTASAHGPAASAHGPTASAHGSAASAHGPAASAHGPAASAHGPAASARNFNAKALATLLSRPCISLPKLHVGVVFVGHVDAGKSSLAGNVLVSTGAVDAREVERCRKQAEDNKCEGWYLSYIMDTEEDERAQGKTVSTGRAKFETPARRFTVLDAPGHGAYVPSMIDGVVQADIGVLVVSARRGEFEAGFERGGQTREHALLAAHLGVKKLVVAVNKMDDTAERDTGEWDQERYNAIASKLKTFLRKSCGYAVRRDCYFTPLSGLTGANLVHRIGAPACSWYTGMSLLELLDAVPLAARDPDAPLRLSVSDRVEGGRTAGKVECGTIFKGQLVVISPTQEHTSVAGITLDGANEVSLALPGEHVHIRFNKLSAPGAIGKGFVVCAQGLPACGRADSFVADIRVLQLLPHKPLLTAGYACVLHMHNIATECVVGRLLLQTDPVSKKKIREPRFAKSHAGGLTARIDVSHCVSAETFDRLPALGQFTLRDEGCTIAVGRIRSLLIKKKQSGPVVSSS